MINFALPIFSMGVEGWSLQSELFINQSNGNIGGMTANNRSIVLAACAVGIHVERQ